MKGSEEIEFRKNMRNGGALITDQRMTFFFLNSRFTITPLRFRDVLQPTENGFQDKEERTLAIEI